MRLLNMAVSQASYNFIPLRSKYSAQHFALKPPQPMFSLPMNQYFPLSFPLPVFFCYSPYSSYCILYPSPFLFIRSFLSHILVPLPL
jgi:hypothetical protein